MMLIKRAPQRAARVERRIADGECRDQRRDKPARGDRSHRMSPTSCLIAPRQRHEQEESRQDTRFSGHRPQQQADEQQRARHPEHRHPRPLRCHQLDERDHRRGASRQRGADRVLKTADERSRHGDHREHGGRPRHMLRPERVPGEREERGQAPHQRHRDQHVPDGQTRERALEGHGGPSEP